MGKEIPGILVRNLSSCPNIGPGRTIVAAGNASRTAVSPAALERYNWDVDVGEALRCDT